MKNVDILPSCLIMLEIYRTIWMETWC